MDKIVTTVKFKKCEIIEGTLQFENFSLSSDECKQIKIWNDYGDPVQITIEPVQSQMFPEEGKAKPKREKSLV